MSEQLDLFARFTFQYGWQEVVCLQPILTFTLVRKALSTSITTHFPVGKYKQCGTLIQHSSGTRRALVGHSLAFIGHSLARVGHSSTLCSWGGTRQTTIVLCSDQFAGQYSGSFQSINQFISYKALAPITKWNKHYEENKALEVNIYA